MSNPAPEIPSSPSVSAPPGAPGRRIPLPLAVVVILAAIGIVGWQGMHYVQGRPRPVLDAFLRAAELGDYESMASFLSTATRARLEEQGADLTKPQDWMPFLFTGGKRVPGEAKLRVEVLEMKPGGDSMYATLRVTVETTPPVEPFEHGLVLRRESESLSYRVMTGVVNGKPRLVRGGTRGPGM